MKKIVALVLSLVMVLSLATTAFGAITLWTENEDYTAKCDTFEATYNTKTNTDPVMVKYIPGQAVKYEKDGTVKQIGIIPHYVIETVVEAEADTPAMFAVGPTFGGTNFNVNYVDEDGNDIAADEEKTVPYGQWPQFAITAKTIEGYTHVGAEWPVWTWAGWDSYEVTFVYSRDTQYFDLTVNYVDVAGVALADPEVTEDIEEGTAYTTEAKDFDGYKLHEVTGDDAEGTMDSAKVVNYVYAPVSTPITTVIQRYVRVDSIPADADASEYILVKAHDPKALPGSAMDNQTAKDAYYILKKVDYVNYFAKADEFKAWSDDCEAYPAPLNADTSKYYTVANKVTGIFDDVSVKFEAAKQGAPVLVGKEVVMLNVRSTVAATQHAWVASAWDEDGVTTAYTCNNCKTVGSVINASINAPAGSKVDKLPDGTLVAYNFVKAPAADSAVVESAKTFDAGIAMYVGMSVMAAAGSAVVLKKKD